MSRYLSWQMGILLCSANLESSFTVTLQDEPMVVGGCQYVLLIVMTESHSCTIPMRKNI